MKNILFVFIIVSLQISSIAKTSAEVSFGKGDALKFGIKPSFSQKRLNDDVIDFYQKWVGDKNGIESAEYEKRGGDGYLAEYKGLDKPVYIIKGHATGDEPEDWLKDSLFAVSTSEATGYGMVIFAYIAGVDKNAQKYFDGLLNLYLRNLSDISIDGKKLHTMSWILPSKYTMKDGSQPVRSCSAADGDMDIAYALLLAHKQWKKPSSYCTVSTPYLDLAIDIIKDIHDFIISEKTNRVLMGDLFYIYTDGTHKEKEFEKRYNHTSTRPSDWMIDHLKAFDIYYPSPKWNKAIDEIIRTMNTVADKNTGLLPDFVEDVDDKAIPALKTLEGEEWYPDSTGKIHTREGLCFLEGPHDDDFFANACRVPWRISSAYALYGDKDLKQNIYKVSNWALKLESRRLREDWDREDWYTYKEGYTMSEFPGSIFNCYKLDGTPCGKELMPKYWDLAAPYTGLCTIAPVAFTVFVDSTKVDFLDKVWNYSVEGFAGDHSGDDNYSGYYDDSITLQNLILHSGNWWIPVK